MLPIILTVTGWTTIRFGSETGSVTRNRWGGVTALCNDDERWRILDTSAFYEISRGGIEYFVDRTGTEVLLQAKTFVATFPDGTAENNLDNLPES